MVSNAGQSHSIRTSPRDDNRPAIVIKFGATLRVINVGEAALIGRRGSVLGAAFDVLDLVLLRPEIPRSMADAFISAVETTERSQTGAGAQKPRSNAHATTISDCAIADARGGQAVRLDPARNPTCNSKIW